MLVSITFAIATLTLAPTWLLIRRRFQVGWVVVITLALLWMSQALVTGLAIRSSRHGDPGRFDDVGAFVVALGMVVLLLTGAAIAAAELALRSSTRAKRARRILDWILYVALAIGLFVPLLLYGWHQGKTGGSRTLPMKWLGFASLTGFVFGYVIKAGWRTRSGPKFWLLLGAFFVVHTGVGILVLMRVETVPLLLYVLITMPEEMVLLYYLDYFLGPDPRYQ